jgi:hypothetical protein
VRATNSYPANHAYTDCNRNTNAYSYTYSDRDTNADTQACPNTEASPDPAASSRRGLICRCIVLRLAANSNSRNAVSFSSERTTKRFPSSRCASAIQIVRPRESIAET